MRVTAQGRAMLARKYAGREFAVYDLQSKRAVGPWSANVGAVYSARDEANRLAGVERFMVTHRSAA